MNSTPNFPEKSKEVEDSIPPIINESDSHDLNKPLAHNHQSGEVDKEIEELRNHVVLQDILGTKVTEGRKSSTRKKKKNGQRKITNAAST